MIRRALGMLCCALIGSVMAHAGDTGLSGFNTLLLRPAAGSGVYGVQGATTLPRGTWYAGSLLHLAHGAITAVMPARATTIDLIGDVLVQDLRAAYGVLPSLQIGLGVPMIWWQRGVNITALDTYRATAFGDLRFDALWNVARDRAGSLGVALQSIIGLPTGNRALFAGDGAVTWEGRIALQKTWRPLALFTNAGYRVLPARTVLTTIDDDHVTFGAGIDVPLPWRNRTWHLRAEVAGESVVSHRSAATTPIEVRAGIRKAFASGWMLDLGAGAGLTAAYGAPTYRTLVGLTWDGAYRQTQRVRPPAPIDYAVYFASGSAHIAAQHYAPLRAIGQALAAMPARRVELHGYTDPRGAAAANMRLSRNRAQQVQKFLQYFGAEPAQCAVVGHGELDVLLGRPHTNRRVNIHE